MFFRLFTISKATCFFSFHLLRIMPTFIFSFLAALGDTKTLTVLLQVNPDESHNFTTLLYLCDVKFSSGAAGADDEMFGEEKTLPLTFFLQRQRAQSASSDLAFLAQWDLYQ